MLYVRESQPEPENLLKVFRTHVLRERLFPKHSTVLVGVSGRSDSVALLRLLANVSRELGIRLIAGHVQGGTPEANADAMFVHHLTTTLTLPFEARETKSDSAADASRPEPWRSPLLDLARQVGATIVATAETRDDAAERFLAMLLGDESPVHGALTSIAGMHVRPLLPFSHEACVTFLTQRGFLFRLNPDALALDTLAAKIRLLVLPILQRHVSADASFNLMAAGEHWGTDDLFLNDLTRSAREEVRWKQSGSRISLDVLRWGELPRSLRRRLLSDAARALAPAAPWSRTDLFSLESACRSLADGGLWETGSLNITRAEGILTLRVNSPPPT